MMDRDAIKQIILTEHEYASGDWPGRAQRAGATDRVPDSQKSVGDWLTYMDCYVRQVSEACIDVNGKDAALDPMRKVANLAITCLMHFGVPRRQDHPVAFSTRLNEAGGRLPMSFDDVWDVVLEEREYQRDLPPNRITSRPGGKKTINDFATLLRHYLWQADFAWCQNRLATDSPTGAATVGGRVMVGWDRLPGDTCALDRVRIVAALCVHCFEIYGVPERIALYVDASGCNPANVPGV